MKAEPANLALAELSDGKWSGSRLEGAVWWAPRYAIASDIEFIFEEFKPVFTLFNQSLGKGSGRVLTTNVGDGIVMSESAIDGLLPFVVFTRDVKGHGHIEKCVTYVSAQAEKLGGDPVATGTLGHISHGQLLAFVNDNAEPELPLDLEEAYDKEDDDACYHSHIYKIKAVRDRVIHRVEEYVNLELKTLTVTEAASGDHVELSPLFVNSYGDTGAQDGPRYEAQVSSDTEQIIVMAEAATSAGTVTISPRANYVYIEHHINLTHGTNTIDVKVETPSTTSERGTRTKLYRINITRQEPGLILPEEIPAVGGGQAAVTLAAGESAQGSSGCSSQHCRHVEITLHNASEGDYTVECWSNLDTQQPWHTGIWHWPTSRNWTQGGCWYGLPDQQVWAVVSNPHGSVTSEPITWPHTTTPITEEPTNPPPTTPSTSTGATISAGWQHSCGIREDGTAVCWGNNNYGQVDAPSGTFTTISAGGWQHSCGVRGDGTAVCWGNNQYGEADAPSGTFTTISAGGWQHSCGVRGDGTAVCWGRNEYGEADAPSGTFTTISAGWQHSCGVRGDGTAVCWGRNRYGQVDAPSGTFTTILRRRLAAFVWGQG